MMAFSTRTGSSKRSFFNSCAFLNFWTVNPESRKLCISFFVARPHVVVKAFDFYAARLRVIAFGDDLAKLAEGVARRAARYARVNVFRARLKRKRHHHRAAQPIRYGGLAARNPYRVADKTESVFKPGAGS